MDHVIRRIIDMLVQITYIAGSDKDFSCTIIGLVDVMGDRGPRYDKTMPKIVEEIWTKTDVMEHFNATKRSSVFKRIKFKSLKEGATAEIGEVFWEKRK